MYFFASRRFARDFRATPLASVTRTQAREWALAHRWAKPAISAMYNDAVREGLIQASPFAELRLPSSRGRRDLEPLAPEQVERLGEVAFAVHGPDYGRVFRALVLFSAWVGLRPGELFALEWKDLQDCTVTIRRCASQLGTLSPPKNGHARTVAYPRRARDAVDAMGARAGDGWVFQGAHGQQLRYWSFLRDWMPVRAAFGRPHMHFYELRHFCASRLMAAGVAPKVIAMQLGHRDGGTLVMSTYGHLYPEQALAQVRAAIDIE